eukprot:Seg127.2 transcript_id=Seg127.2/GoldUCD/mRNA.D3Y31 product="ADP-ribosylation factor-binding protein GGA3" protein_id=Seg127.2/GoldUCD/D3Y31
MNEAETGTEVVNLCKLKAYSVEALLKRFLFISGDSAPSQPSADSLLDLGLDFDGSSDKPSNSQPETSASSSLLDEQFKILGLDSDITTSASNQAGQQTEQQQIPNNDQWGSFGAAPQQLMQQQQQMNMQAQGTYYTTNQFSGNMNPLAGVNLLGQMASPGNMPATNFNMVPNIRSTTSSASTTGNTLNSQSLKTKQSEVKPARNDILDFDVFADFKKDDASKTKSHGAEEEQMKDRGTGKQVETSGLLDLLGDSNTSSSDAFQSSAGKPAGKFVPPLSSSAQSPEKYFVPLEAIEPTSYPPVTILDKDGVKTILNIVKDKRDVANPNVIAVVFSTLSTNVLSISEFKIEISVPKIMRIKLQTPSATTLPPFNPLLPPSAISQIMLIANPSKETIRMQVRVSYMAGSNNISETLSIDGLPVTVVEHQEDVKFELEGDRLPSFLRGSTRGDFFLTSSKIIFVNKNTSGKYASFSMEFRSLKNIEVKQPIFGANALTGFVTAEQGGGWDGKANFKVEFKSGGAIEFAEKLKHTAGQARAGRVPVQPAPAAGFYPPPPLGGYYYAPYNTAYGVSQPPQAGMQPAYAAPYQGQGAPPPYPGTAPPQQGPENDKAREAYSSGQNVYVPTQYETPPPYAPGYNNDKKTQ